LAACRAAVAHRDFAALAAVVEEDSDLMHAVMETSAPPLKYRMPVSLALAEAIGKWRSAGTRACYTLDAGPNVHCLCPLDEAEAIRDRLEAVPGVIRVISASAGGGARLLAEDDPLTGLL
jgi:diphosphomevalonate decarboxylase